MPPRSKKRAPATEDYDSDNGFVADSKPTAKKAKTAKSGGPANSTGNKDAQKGKSVSGGGMVGTNGEEFWEVSPFCLEEMRMEGNYWCGKIWDEMGEG